MISGRLVACAAVFSVSMACLGQSVYVHPTSLLFGKKVLTEEPTFETTVTIARQVSSEMRISELLISGPHMADFSVSTGPTSGTLPRYGYGYTQFGVVFKAGGTGQRSANLRVITENPVTTTTVYLLGLGVLPRTSPYVGLFDGVGPGQSTIGPGGHYATLSNAFTAIQNAGSLTGGDWTFHLSGDHAVAGPSYLGVYHTNGHGITFRPAPAATPKITFNNNGSLIIGRPVSDNAVPNIPTHNITIDGSGTSGGTDRSLTLENNAGTGASALISVIGDCDNFALRNCNLRCYPSTANNYIHSAIDLLPDKSYYTPHVYVLGEDNLAPGDFPDSAVVENCDILTSGLGPMLGISMHDRPQPDGTFQKQLIDGSRAFTARNNDIRTNAGGIIVYPVLGAELAHNHITITPSFSAPISNIVSAIDVNGARFGEVPADIAIHGNTINIIEGETTHPLAGIGFRGNTTSSTVEVSNNVITGLTAAAPGFNVSTRVAIANDSESYTTATVAHNSIEMTARTLSSIPGATYAIGSMYTQDDFAGVMLVKNNIVRMEIDRAAVYNQAGSGAVVADYNDLFTTGGSVLGYSRNQVPIVTLERWKSGTGQEVNSFSQDPYLPASAGAGVWSGPAGGMIPDLHFTAMPGSLYMAAPIPGIDRDIDGDMRLIPTTIGADEPLPASYVSD